MSQFWFSLEFISQNSLWKFFTFRGYKSIYSRVCEECEKSFFLQNRAFWQLTREWDESWENCQARLYFLSCSALAVVTFQLPTCFTCVAFWQVNSRKSLRRSSHENPLECTHTWIVHILLHTTFTWFPHKYRVSNYWNTRKFGME